MKFQDPVLMSDISVTLKSSWLCWGYWWQKIKTCKGGMASVVLHSFQISWKFEFGSNIRGQSHPQDSGIILCFSQNEESRLTSEELIWHTDSIWYRCHHVGGSLVLVTLFCSMTCWCTVRCDAVLLKNQTLWNAVASCLSRNAQWMRYWVKECSRSHAKMKYWYCVHLQLKKGRHGFPHWEMQWNRSVHTFRSLQGHV